MLKKESGDDLSMKRLFGSLMLVTAFVLQLGGCVNPEKCSELISASVDISAIPSESESPLLEDRDITGGGTPDESKYIPTSNGTESIIYPSLDTQESPTPKDSSFSIHFIDVGQADSALVECDGEYMLID